MSTLFKPAISKIHKQDRCFSIKPTYQTKHVLILMSDTGGGHRAAAEAIQEGFKLLYGETVLVTIVDAWKDHVGWPINRLAGSYSWIVNKALWLWKSLWLLEKKPYLLNIFYSLIYPLVAPGLLKLFKTQHPHVIVSVHPLLTPFSLLALEKTNLNIPFVTVVTDMMNSWRVWYHPSTHLCLVPTRSIGQQAVSQGIPSAKIEVVGQPVSPTLTARSEEKSAVRCKLGLDPDRPVILLAGGGEGYGPVFEIAQAISRQMVQVQLIIVAGRNKWLRTKLEACHWQIPTLVFGFVTNMPELMTAADVFVTKAGPGSLAEAFITRLPMIIFDYIPGQEDSNVQYVLQHQAGVFVKEPDEIVNLLQAWFKPNNQILTQMAHNAAQLAQPESALIIARRVHQLMIEH